MMKSLLTAVLLVLSLVAMSQKPEVFSTEAGAINGYDAVAYFKDQKPVKGDSKITFEWSGATWHFSSAENRDEFAKNPEKYAPQYGGYCAWGLAQGGYKAPTLPEAWTIVNDKLYLNYDLSVQKRWLPKKEELIKKGDEKWPTVKKEK